VRASPPTVRRGDNHSIGTASISADGRFVAFVSDASNLVFEPAFGRHAYVKDMVTGAIERVSVDSVDSGGGQANGASTDPDISADGSTVAFFSAATNLVCRGHEHVRRVPEPGRVPGHLRARTVNGRGGIAPAPLKPSQALC
jgi:Tol biopolymer transport system component